MSSSAKKLIIVKHLSAIESLAKIDEIIFDKTGTITLGKPEVTKIDYMTKEYSEAKMLSIAASLENNSLHPLAQAVVKYVAAKHISFAFIHSVKEVIGQGMFGVYENKNFHIGKYQQ